MKGEIVCIPEGFGYPITSEALSRAKTAYPRPAS
jgi:hypothetical protein